jgi:hypothetical protein
LNIKIANLNGNNSARIAVDSAIITILLNFLAFIINSPATINVMLDNRLDIPQLILTKGRNGKLDLSIFFDYKYKWLKKLINKFGGAKIKIINTGWTSIEIEKRQEYPSGAIDYSNPSKYILIDFNKLIPDDKLNGKVYFQLIISSNTTIKSDGEISTEVNCKKVVKLLKSILINIECEKELVMYRELD